jgi:hypothetical protein
VNLPFVFSIGNENKQAGEARGWKWDFITSEESESLI